jgi:hypothetical protein
VRVRLDARIGVREDLVGGDDACASGARERASVGVSSHEWSAAARRCASTQAAPSTTSAAAQRRRVLCVVAARWGCAAAARAAAIGTRCTFPCRSITVRIAAGVAVRADGRTRQVACARGVQFLDSSFSSNKGLLFAATLYAARGASTQRGTSSSTVQHSFGTAAATNEGNAPHRRTLVELVHRRV